MEIKVTRTMIKQFKVNPDWYPKNSTDEEIIDIEKSSFHADSELYFSDIDDDDIKFEVIKND